jgi:hypothetical protein
MLVVRTSRVPMSTIHDWMIAQQSQTKAVTEAFAAVLENGSEPRTIVKRSVTVLEERSAAMERGLRTRVKAMTGGAHNRPLIGGELYKTVQGETAPASIARTLVMCMLPAWSTTSSWRRAMALSTVLDQGLDYLERFTLSATNAADPLKECDRYSYGTKTKAAPGRQLRPRWKAAQKTGSEKNGER